MRKEDIIKQLPYKLKISLDVDAICVFFEKRRRNYKILMYVFLICIVFWIVAVYIDMKEYNLLQLPVNQILYLVFTIVLYFVTRNEISKIPDSKLIKEIFSIKESE